ncbi:hypothetical protein [Chryseolinea soli]|uniref:Outer membrane protein beta-barrel domain-containing protein n=1 Tax=Chryseolinea soli TaxID=2321403 RepID=A0A385SSB3_9BACT|nr:hypothetical protein [Chryseolinea soli]AYB31688.1 hypothetical protein D4L85_14440 [Chryseolinea soli]
MKNLPEHEAFKALENRLNNYTEQPDDDLWQKIAAGLPSSKPVWAPWMNQFAGVVVVAALGWALGYSSAPEVGGNTLAIVQPKSASVDDVAPDRATDSQIHPENTDAKDALLLTGEQELAADAFTNKKSTGSSQGSGSSLSGAGSGLNSDASDASSLNQPSGSAHDLASDVDSQTGAHSMESQVSASSPASSIFPTSNENRHSHLQPDQSTPYAESKALDAAVDRSQGSAKQQSSPNNLSSHTSQAIRPADGTTSVTTQSTTESNALDAVADGSQGSAKQESPLNNLSYNAQQAIKPADGTSSAANLSTQGSYIKHASDSSQLNGVLINLSPADSAVTDGQTVPYNRPKKKRAGISFYALFSPTLSFQTATPSARDGVIIQKFNKPSILSGDRLGIGLEAGVQGRLSKKFEYFAGLSVYHQSQTLQYTYQSSGSFVIENGGDDLSYTVKPTTAERSVSYSMLNIGAQAGVLYTLTENRLSHKIGLGLQYQKGLAHASSSEPYDNSSSSYLNYQILYRAELALNGRLTFIVQPSVTRTWLVNETLHVPFTLKQYRPGVSVGLSYRLMR